MVILACGVLAVLIDAGPVGVTELTELHGIGGCAPCSASRGLGIGVVALSHQVFFLSGGLFHVGENLNLRLHLAKYGSLDHHFDRSFGPVGFIIGIESGLVCTDGCS